MERGPDGGLRKVITSVTPPLKYSGEDSIFRGGKAGLLIRPSSPGRRSPAEEPERSLLFFFRRISIRADADLPAESHNCVTMIYNDRNSI